MIENNTIYNFIRECEASEKINLINLVLIQNEKILAQFCKPPYKNECKQLLFSMTKSFTSLAIGVAYDKGLVKLNDLVVTYFQNEMPKNPHPNLLKMRLEHLLTMTTGIHDNTYAELVVQPNWISAFLAQDFPHEPGTHYRYSTHSTHMLSAVIEKVSGQNLSDFLNENMFYPMDINNAQWERSPEGLIAGGMGLSLCPNDLIKVADMLLNYGLYNGHQIISERYLILATSPHVVKQDDIGDSGKYFKEYKYGYQFHISPNGMYSANGAFGQFCVICPEKKTAVIATSQKTDTENFYALIDKYFVSNYISNEYISRDYLDGYLRELSCSTPNRNIHQNILTCIENNYKMETNELNISQIKLSENRITFKFVDGVQDEISIDFEKPVYGKSHFIKDLQIHLQEHCAYATWEENATLLLTVYYIETPYVAKYKFKFINDGLSFDFNVNVNMTLKGFSVINVSSKN